MKTLKFMLAAATAIGIASVAQAGQNRNASTGFEKLPQGTKVITGIIDNKIGDTDVNSYFCYVGANADDNESEIVAFTDNATPVTRPSGITNFDGADATSRANALQVSTGTDPLLRTFRPVANSAPQAGEEITTSTYIDTLVQFTVTPSTDTVPPGDDDKLMIYLKETATTTTGDDGVAVVTTATNLVVKGGYLESAASASQKEYVVQNIPVEPGVWYRLTVEAIPASVVNKDMGPQLGLMVFRVKINGVDCVFGGDTINTSDQNVVVFFMQNQELFQAIGTRQVVLSLKAATSSTSKNALQAVGFAGEGLVDDLVITDVDPAVRTVNFTLAFDENKVTAIEYTIGDVPYWQTDKLVEEVAERSVITIKSVTYADGYEFDSFTTTGLTAAGDNKFTVNGDAAASLTINAKAKASSGVVPGGEAVVVDTREAAEALAVSVTSPDETVVSTADYMTYFKTVITETADNKFSVTAELDETVVKPDETAADLAGKFDEISEAGEVTVVAKPGLYYSVKQGSSLGDMPEGARTMATGGTVNLKATKFPGAGFYQIMVNFTDKQ